MHGSPKGFRVYFSSMLNEEQMRKMAMTFDEVTEEPHFEKTSFRVKKKIFATFDSSKQLVCVCLSLVDQSVFCSYNKEIVYPVPNKWGQKGWTLVDLTSVPEEMLRDAIACAYCRVAPAKLAQKYLTT